MSSFWRDAAASWPSLAGPTVNICCYLIGSGWASIPLTFHQMGFAVGICSLLLLALANAYSCIVMLQSAEEFGTPESFHDLTEVSLGRIWAVLLDWVVGLTSFFGCTQKLILAGDFGVAIKQRIITHNYLPNRALI